MVDAVSMKLSVICFFKRSGFLSFPLNGECFSVKYCLLSYCEVLLVYVLAVKCFMGVWALEFLVVAGVGFILVCQKEVHPVGVCL